MRVALIGWRSSCPATGLFPHGAASGDTAGALAGNGRSSRLNAGQPLAARALVSYLLGMTEPGFHSRQQIKGELEEKNRRKASGARSGFFASAPLVLLAVLAVAVYYIACLSGQ